MLLWFIKLVANSFRYVESLDQNCTYSLICVPHPPFVAIVTKLAAYTIGRGHRAVSMIKLFCILLDELIKQ